MESIGEAGLSNVSAAFGPLRLGMKSFRVDTWAHTLGIGCKVEGKRLDFTVHPS